MNIRLNTGISTGSYPKLMEGDNSNIYIFFSENDGILLIPINTSAASGDWVDSMNGLHMYSGPDIILNN